MTISVLDHLWESWLVVRNMILMEAIYRLTNQGDQLSVERNQFDSKFLFWLLLSTHPVKCYLVKRLNENGILLGSWYCYILYIYINILSCHILTCFCLQRQFPFLKVWKNLKSFYINIKNFEILGKVRGLVCLFSKRSLFSIRRHFLLC